ncbi:RNA polymerase sigma factor [Streptomyces sp. 4N509B]|uniref:RNA polymerase sigma factor n=1 Tax=Streptomyces sp. 4N509B TaxID=3457413 RepID=UPI003FD4A7E2
MRHETPPHWDRSTRDRLLAGEAAALGELYDRFASLAYGIAQRILGDEEDTGRVTEEVFARLWECPEDYDPELGPMRSWVAAEAHRRAVDLLRERVRRAERGDGAAERDGRCGRADAESAAGALRAAATAARADYIFSAMPLPLRDALHLTRFEYKDYRRTAGRLGIAEAEACRRIRLGLQLLSTAAEYPVDGVREEHR